MLKIKLIFAVLLLHPVMAEIDVQMPTPVEIQSDAGRGDSKGAGDLAIFGAIMAQSQCTQLTAKSMDDELSEDDKQMYQMMAQQQCAQAAASQKAGEENKRNFDKLKQPAKMPELGKTPEFKAPQAPKDESADQSVLAAFGEIETPGSPRQFAPIQTPSTEELLQAANNPEAEKLPEDDGVITPPPPKKSSLASIQKNRLTVDEGSDKGNPITGITAGAIGPIGLAAPATGESSLDNGNPIGNAEEEGIDYGNDGRNNFAVSEASRGASGSTSAEGNSEPFGSSGVDMKALFDDGVRSNNLVITRSGGVIQVRPKNKKPNSRLTIFEFANWKYQKMAYEELRVMTRTQKRALENIGKQLKLSRSKQTRGKP